jgi:D-alanyl-D-alanine carboxypeptidase/D-alanyl-D-alanine-endopeptidase (penicillin-binding protein 4)
MPGRRGNQPNSRAARHVYAKTGTSVANHPAGAMTPVVFAGFLQLPSGQWLIFAQFTTHQASLAAVTELADQAHTAMAEIATASYGTLGRSPQ